MFENLSRTQLTAYKLDDNVIVTASMHSGIYIGDIDAKRAEIIPPGRMMHGHGIDDDSVQIEDQSQSAGHTCQTTHMTGIIT